uniref:Uncharacterized protein n=1 Tax=Ceratitis capitata TaxID=7213 RepID=W8B4B1_CERCA
MANMNTLTLQLKLKAAACRQAVKRHFSHCSTVNCRLCALTNYSKSRFYLCIFMKALTNKSKHLYDKCVHLECNILLQVLEKRAKSMHVAHLSSRQHHHHHLLT